MAVWPSNGQIFVCHQEDTLSRWFDACRLHCTNVDDTLAKRPGTDVASAFLTTLNRPQWPAPQRRIYNTAPFIVVMHLAAYKHLALASLQACL